MANPIKKIDQKAEEKGGAFKTIWQAIKFLVVSLGVTIIQLTLAGLLPKIFDSVQAGLPGLLQGIFKPDSIFDIGKATRLAEIEPSVAEKIAKYVLNPKFTGPDAKGIYHLQGIVTWGYVLPFFLSNAIANIYGYIQNKKTTFKSDAPKKNMIFYIILLTCLILFSTWLQAFVYGFLSPKIGGLARTIAGLAAGLIQMLVLFPVEKFVLLKEKQVDDDDDYWEYDDEYYDDDDEYYDDDDEYYDDDDEYYDDDDYDDDYDDDEYYDDDYDDDDDY